MISDDDAIAISRLIDGDLDDQEAAQLKERLLQDPDLRAVYDVLKTDNDDLQALASQIENEPLPQQTIDTLEKHALEKQALEIDAQEPTRTWLMPAIAASVAVFIVGAITFLPTQSTMTLADALNNAASGTTVETNDGDVELIVTFNTADGWCREYVAEGRRAVACRAGSDWQTVVSERAIERKEDEYSTAGAASTVEDYVMGNISGSPADPATERQLLEDWGS